MDANEASDVLDLPPPQDQQAQPAAQPPEQVEDLPGAFLGENGERPPDQDDAPVAPKGHLKLTDEQRKDLVAYVVQRIDECRSQMGLHFGIGMAQQGSWAWDRQIAQLQYDGMFKWREALGAIFQENNWSMNVPKRFIRLMSAKVCADLLGTEPFFASMPERAENAELSKQVERKVQRDVGDSNAAEVLREAVRVAITTGERVVKSAYVHDYTVFRGPMVVAVDAQGLPIKTPTGEYILPKDDFIPDPQVQGQVRLKKDPAFTLDANSPYLNPQTQKLNYRLVEDLQQKLIHKDGLELGSLNCEDFLFPITVPSLDKADIMVHVYDEPEDSLKQTWGEITSSNYFNRSGALSAASQANEQHGEQETKSEARPLVNVHEVYVRRDVDGDGQDEWIFMVLDYKSQNSIYEEYLGNLKMKAPPFKFIRGVESVPGRAYGNGVYKMFEHKNLFIDIQFNRVALKSSKEGSITFIHRDGTEEGKNGLQITVGDKKPYYIPAQSMYNKDRPPIFRVNLNEVDEYAMKLLETMIQTGMLEFGIVSAADGSEADLNASGTATGIRNIERTGNLLHRMTEDMIAKDIEGVLDQCTDIILENMDDEETQFSPDSSELVKLNRDEIRTMPRQVRLLLTKVRSEEAIQTSAQVISLLDAYYARPMWLRKKVRGEYIKQLKTLEVQDADELLEEPTDKQIQDEAAASGKTEPPKETITAKLEDFTPEERPQIVQKYFGINPSPAGTPTQGQLTAPPSGAAPQGTGQPPQPVQPSSTAIPPDDSGKSAV